MQTNDVGFFRLKQIIGDHGNLAKGRLPVPPIIPVSKSTWWDGVARGIYPKPIRWSGGITVWRKADILDFCERVGRSEDGK